MGRRGEKVGQAGGGIEGHGVVRLRSAGRLTSLTMTVKRNDDVVDSILGVVNQLEATNHGRGEEVGWERWRNRGAWGRSTAFGWAPDFVNDVARIR